MSAMRAAIRTRAILALVAIVGARASAQSPTPVARGFSATADVTMRIYVPTGALRVTVWDRDSVDVRGTIASGSSFFGGGARTHIKMGVEPSVMTDPKLPGANWDVRVPRRARLWIKLIDGSLDVSGTLGELEAYAVRGTMRVRDAAGVTSLESIDAPVTVERARGDVRVRGSKGAVTLTSVQGTVSVATVSGPVFLTAVTSEGRVETIGGDVTFTGGVLRGSGLELQTHSGAIIIEVARSHIPVLDLSTRAGPVAGESLVGRDANGRLSARSFKGHITVRASTARSNP